MDHSAFTPFLRRFTDEKARDVDDTKALYRRVATLHERSQYKGLDGRIALGTEVYVHYCDLVPDDLISHFNNCVDELLALERPIFLLPEPQFGDLSLTEAVDLRRFLRAKEYFHTHEEKVTGTLKNHLIPLFVAIAEMLPESATPSPFTVPLVNVLPLEFLDKIIGQMFQQACVETGLFVEVSRTLIFNCAAVSDIKDINKPNKPLKGPSTSGLSAQDAAKAFFKGTPFLDLLLAPIPLKLGFEERYSHMHVLGGSGAGKTTLLQNLILTDLISDNPPAMVIIDSQGDLINKISHLALFDPDHGKLADRLVLITPKDIDNPPALNIFDLNRSRLDQYGEAAREQVTAGVIQTFDYLFAGLLGADLTAKQGVFFRFVARLMLSLPETMGRPATILDMMALMDDPTPYEEAIRALPPIPRAFFERDFGSRTFVQTKEQIRYRLNAILENPTLARLFTTPRTKVDVFSTLNNGGIILVDTAKDFLKGASAHFGRIFISFVLQAILERAVIPERDRRPTFLIVDEAAAYFDSNIDDFLTEARKYRCGCIFAHQFLDQAAPALRASFAANTAIKMAGGASTSDARAIASDMRTTPDFILAQPRLHFGCFVRAVTPNAVSVPVEVGRLERQERLSSHSYERLLDLNRQRVSLPQAPSTPSIGPSEAPLPGDLQIAPVSEDDGRTDRSDPAAPSSDW